MHTPFFIATLIIMQPDRTKCKPAATGAVVPGASASTWLSAAAAALLGAAAAPTAHAQEYPSKPVVIVVPAAAGGPTDTLARNLGVAMGSALKQQMIIDNSGGAGGTIGINKAAKARPDGYTVLLYHIGMSTSPALYRKLPYDTVNDFEYIGQVADVPMALVAKKEMSQRTFAAFLAYAKANQSTLTYANAGIGSASYLCGLLFMSTIQAEFTTVPYKGTGPAMTDLVAGRVDFMCDQTTNTTPQIKAGTNQGLRCDFECARALAAGGPHARRAGLEGLRAGRLERAVCAQGDAQAGAGQTRWRASDGGNGSSVQNSAGRSGRRAGPVRQGDS